MVVDRPGHGVERIGQEIGSGRGKSPAIRGRGKRGCADDRGGAIREDGVGDDLLRIPAIEVVQAAEFDRTAQHAGRGIGAGKGGGDAQAVERPVAAHEANVRPLGVRRQTQTADQLNIHARGREAGTGHGHQVRDFLGI